VAAGDSLEVVEEVVDDVVPFDPEWEVVEELEVFSWEDVVEVVETVVVVGEGMTLGVAEVVGEGVGVGVGVGVGLGEGDGDGMLPPPLPSANSQEPVRTPMPSGAK